MKMTLKYKDYEGTAEIDVERDVCRGKLLFIRDLVTYESKTPAGLRTEFEAAVEDYLETCKNLNRDPQRPYNGVFQFRTSPEKHRLAAVRAMQDDVSLNEVVDRALDAYLHGTQQVHNVTIKLTNPIGSDVNFLQSSPSLEHQGVKRVAITH